VTAYIGVISILVCQLKFSFIINFPVAALGFLIFKFSFSLHF